MRGSDGTGPRAASADPTRVVCCVGDIHGFHDKLVRLWGNLERRVGGAAFRTALLIFLGDYCDRGPQTREVIDFLLSLPSRYPEQRHVFLCGNHDLAFSAFVGALPRPQDGSSFSETWAEYAANEEREGWFKGEGYWGMHLQGRRWGGVIRDRWNSKRGAEYMGSIYDAGPTFQSYGVPHGSIGEKPLLSGGNCSRICRRLRTKCAALPMIPFLSSRTLKAGGDISSSLLGTSLWYSSYLL